MAEIPCPAPGCSTKWPANQPPEVLTLLISLHASTAHPGTTPPTSAPSVQAEKVRRPTVKAAGTSEEWAYFTQRWCEYKAATHLTGTDVIFQLLECCEETLRKDLTRTFGALNSSDETTILDHMKTLAVRQENVMVARCHLQQMTQDRDEPVRTFAARIRGQAGVCRFEVDCPACTHTINYSDIMVRDAIIRGLEDSEIRLDILSESDQDMSLEKALQLIEAKESGKRSANRLLNTDAASTAAAAHSQYRQSRRQNQPRILHPPTPSMICGYCGKRGHSQSRQERVCKCPAYNHTCAQCGKLHHFDSMCRNSQRKQVQPSTTAQVTHDDTASTFQSLCSIELGPPSNALAITLDHHIYDEFCGVWKKRASDPQPLVTVRVWADPADMRDLGFSVPFSSPTAATTFPAMADTGCQSCLAGTNLLAQLGLKSSDLAPVSMKMTAANDKRIDIMGALVLQIAGATQSGRDLVTRQIVYFTESSSRLFLSKQACVALQIIPGSFPTHHW